MLSRQSDEAASGEPKGGGFFRVPHVHHCVVDIHNAQDTSDSSCTPHATVPLHPYAQRYRMPRAPKHPAHNTAMDARNRLCAACTKATLKYGFHFQ